jgi:hypothetical protein
MLGETIDSISILIGIELDILPNIITFIVVLVLLFLGFKMNLSGVSSILILMALYTVSMSLLTMLGIDSIFNIITLIGDLL